MAIEVTQEGIKGAYLQIYHIKLTREPPKGAINWETKFGVEVFYQVFDNNKEIIARGTHFLSYIPEVHNVYELAYSELKKIPGYEDAKDI